MISPRLCKTCEQLKPINSFYRSNVHADGYEWRCKPCRKAQRRQSEKHPKDPLRVEEIRLSIRKTGNEPMPWVVSDGQKINVSCVSVGQAIKIKDVVLKYLTDEIPDRPLKLTHKPPTPSALRKRRERERAA